MLREIWNRYLAVARPLRIGAFLALMAAIFMAARLFVLDPQQSELETLSGRVEEIKILKAKKEKLAQSIVMQSKEIRKIEAELAGALDKLPDQKEIPQLLLRASALGNEAGLDITLFRQKPEVFREFYMEVPVEMSARTDYHQLRRYFSSLGAMPRIVNVTDIVITNPKVTVPRVVLQASFLLTTYRFLSEQERDAIKKAQAKAKKA
jgi:type IV pilus assembly protein PilO